MKFLFDKSLKVLMGAAWFMNNTEQNFHGSTGIMQISSDQSFMTKNIEKLIIPYKNKSASVKFEPKYENFLSNPNIFSCRIIYLSIFLTFNMRGPN